jgi:hypothetical protein
VLAYLGIEPDGSYTLCVSVTPLNVIGTRLETPRRVLPEVISKFVADPSNKELALAALKAAQGFLDGTEAGINPPEFGDPLPKVRRKK